MLHLSNKKGKYKNKQGNIRDLKNKKMIHRKNQEVFLLKKEELIWNNYLVFGF